MKKLIGGGLTLALATLLSAAPQAPAPSETTPAANAKTAGKHRGKHKDKTAGDQGKVKPEAHTKAKK